MLACCRAAKLENAEQLARAAAQLCKVAFSRRHVLMPPAALYQTLHEQHMGAPDERMTQPSHGRAGSAGRLLAYLESRGSDLQGPRWLLTSFRQSRISSRCSSSPGCSAACWTPLFLPDAGVVGCPRSFRAFWLSLSCGINTWWGSLKAACTAQPCLSQPVLSGDSVRIRGVVGGGKQGDAALLPAVNRARLQYALGMTQLSHAAGRGWLSSVACLM